MSGHLLTSAFFFVMLRLAFKAFKISQSFLPTTKEEWETCKSAFQMYQLISR